MSFATVSSLALPLFVWAAVGAPLGKAGSAEKDRVFGLPGLPTELRNLSQYAGYLDASVPDGLEGRLFYWLVEHEGHGVRSNGEAPLVLWLQGGPGASSLFSLFSETGPFRVVAGNSGAPSLIAAPLRWTQAVHMLYLDQPYGTGFSFAAKDTVGSVAHSEEQLRDAAAAALLSFFSRHPRFAGRPFFIFGESFAGHMAPNIAWRLLQLRAPYSETAAAFPINLRGLAIGDGWVEPTAQNIAFPKYAFAMGLIGDELRSTLEVQGAACAKVIASGNYTAAFNGPCYYQMLNPIVKAGGGVSPYDIRKFGVDATGGFDAAALQHYLDSDPVRAALHLPSVSASGPWGKGAGAAFVEKALIPDLNAPTSLPHWPFLMEQGVRILVYNGNFDLICNHIGTDAYLRQSLWWSGRQSFLRSPRTVWRLPSKEVPSTDASPPIEQLAGWSRSAGNLTQVVVANAGHMAPADAPLACMDMVRRFVADIPFDSSDIPFDFQFLV